MAGEELCEVMKDHIIRLTAENAKLRAALESIAYTDTLPGITLTRERMIELAHIGLK